MKFIVALLGLFLVSVPQASAQGLSDDAIRRLLIEQSIAGYSGNCPCPYNSKGNGHRCGGSSAYSRPGGRSPLCYPSDVSAADITTFRARRTDSQDLAAAKPAKLRTAAPAPPPMPLEPAIGMRPGPADGGEASNLDRRAGAGADDCPPGTAPIRWNGKNICVGTQDSLARATGAAAAEPSAEEAGSEPVSFADVLSGLQARAAITGQPVEVPVRSGQNRPAAPPATGLLNCAPGTRVSYLDGRIECR